MAACAVFVQSSDGALVGFSPGAASRSGFLRGLQSFETGRSEVQIPMTPEALQDACYFLEGTEPGWLARQPLLGRIDALLCLDFLAADSEIMEQAASYLAVALAERSPEDLCHLLGLPAWWTSGSDDGRTKRRRKARASDLPGRLEVHSAFLREAERGMPDYSPGARSASLLQTMFPTVPVQLWLSADVDERANCSVRFACDLLEERKFFDPRKLLCFSAASPRQGHLQRLPDGVLGLLVSQMRFVDGLMLLIATHPGVRVSETALLHSELWVDQRFASRRCRCRSMGERPRPRPCPTDYEYCPQVEPAKLDPATLRCLLALGANADVARTVEILYWDADFSPVTFVMTPLGMATAHRDEASVKILTRDCGADASAGDALWVTPLAIDDPVHLLYGYTRPLFFNDAGPLLPWSADLVRNLLHAGAEDFLVEDCEGDISAFSFVAQAGTMRPLDGEVREIYELLRRHWERKCPCHAQSPLEKFPGERRGFIGARPAEQAALGSFRDEPSEISAS